MASVELPCGRRAVRKAVDLRCSVTPKLGRTRRLRVSELSPLGAWLRTSKPLPEGSLVRLRLTLPDGEPAILRAEVMWTQRGRGAGMAVELLSVEPHERERIARALDASPVVSSGNSRFSFRDQVA